MPQRHQIRRELLFRSTRAGIRGALADFRRNGGQFGLDVLDQRPDTPRRRLREPRRRTTDRPADHRPRDRLRIPAITIVGVDLNPLDPRVQATHQPRPGRGIPARGHGHLHDVPACRDTTLAVGDPLQPDLPRATRRLGARVHYSLTRPVRRRDGNLPDRHLLHLGPQLTPQHPHTHLRGSLDPRHHPRHDDRIQQRDHRCQRQRRHDAEHDFGFQYIRRGVLRRLFQIQRAADHQLQIGRELAVQQRQCARRDMPFHRPLDAIGTSSHQILEITQVIREFPPRIRNGLQTCLTRLRPFHPESNLEEVLQRRR